MEMKKKTCSEVVSTWRDKWYKRWGTSHTSLCKVSSRTEGDWILLEFVEYIHFTLRCFSPNGNFRCNISNHHSMPLWLDKMERSERTDIEFRWREFFKGWWETRPRCQWIFSTEKYQMATGERQGRGLGPFYKRFWKKEMHQVNG